MKQAERGWGRYALAIAHSRAEAEQLYALWEERAGAVPGAEVRVMSWKDPLGGESFMFVTQCQALVPLHGPFSRERLEERLRSLRREGSPEDGEAIAFVEMLLAGRKITPKSREQRTDEILLEFEERFRAIEERRRGE